MFLSLMGMIQQLNLSYNLPLVGKTNPTPPKPQQWFGVDISNIHPQNVGFSKLT